MKEEGARNTMAHLSPAAYAAALACVAADAPPLHRAALSHRVRGGPAAAVVEALRAHQNGDGGFGRGLELDILYPGSSPLATSIAFQWLVRYEDVPGAPDMIARGVRYFEDTYLPERQGWLAQRRELNAYPHAPWWHVDEETGMCAIDKSWGNPSAEILGYLWRYRRLLSRLDVGALVATALEHLASRAPPYESFHEVFCFIRMRNEMPPDVAKAMEPPLREAVAALVETDPASWGAYVATPLDVAPLPESDRYGIPESAFTAQLDYLVDTLEREGSIAPTWTWGAYEDAWERQKRRWTGSLTAQALCTLGAFGRLPPAR